MSKFIVIRIKNVYGNETIYPACREAEIFAGIAGTKTLTRDTLRRIEALGYQITVEAPAWRSAA